MTHDHHIGDLVVDADQPGPATEVAHRFTTPEMTAEIGIVVDKVPGYGPHPDVPGYGPKSDVNVLHVLWSDGTTRTRWDYQVLPLKE